VREQFLVEAGDGAQVKDLAEMNRVFQAWTETGCHRTVHSETGEAPAARWEKASPAGRAVPEPGLLPEAFWWSGRRRADKTALARMHGNACQAGARLAGPYAELVFDPSGLGRVEVRAGGKPAGTAVPFTAGRHRHPKTRLADGQPRTEPARTGIGYLAALGDGHDAALRDQVSYRFLVPGPAGEPGNRGEPEDGEGSEAGGRG
jgi:putative transposase